MSQVVQRVAELAVSAVPGADEVSITLLENDRPASVAFTSDLAVHLDERQYARGFGPCTEAALSGELIHLPDTAEDDRYPDFSRLAVRAGVRSSLSVGMPAPQRALGGINFYGHRAHAFDDGDLEAAQSFADHAAVSLTNADVLASSTRLAQQMQEAMRSRATIEQAKGILMARLGCTADEAFGYLSRQSQQVNRKLHEIAAELVEQTAQQRSR
jgi:GAF domain-containing protein